MSRAAFGWRSAARIAWREARASAGKFAFVILAVAAGVGALTGVRGFSASFRDMLLRDARTLMAADLTVRLFHQPDERERAALDSLVADGARLAWVTETVSMASSPASRPVMVAVKAVEPGVYPFYGEVETDPPASLGAVLGRGEAALNDDAMLRLGVGVGDRIRLGDTELTVGATVLVEPDRMTGSFNVGPRVMLSRDALDATGLIRQGSRAAQRFLFRLPPVGRGLTIERARARLEEVFPERSIADFRETHPTIRRGLDRATNFLGLVSLVAMIVGALGVAVAMHSHLQQRLDTIAVMKCLGARSAQILRIYLLQTLALGLAGSLLGAAVGAGVQAWAPNFMRDYFPSAPSFEFRPEAVAQALIIGVLTTLLFTLPTLLAVRRVRPALIFRREMAEARRGLRRRLAESRASLAAGVAIVAGLGAVATWLGGSAELGLWFAGGLTAALAALGAASWALLRTLERLPRWLPFRLPVAWRHGLANLHRPGVHAEAVLTALGVGVTFTLSVYLIQTSVLERMVESAPPDMPNVFLVNVTEAEREELLAFLNAYPGVRDVELTPSIASRLLSVDGRPVEELDLGDQADRFRQTRPMSWTERRPESMEVVRGQWWAPGEPGAVAAVREDIAEALGLRVGSRLEWLVGSRRVAAEIRAVYRVESIRPNSSTDYLLNRAALADAPAVYYGGLRLPAESAVELQRQAYERFPTVLVINAADVVRIVQEVVDRIAVVVEFVSAFAILGGVVILASSVAATRMRRVRETAILKTLGASRATVASIFTVEFVVLGLAAGAIGAALASGFSALLLDRVLDARYEFAWGPNLAAVAATAAVATAAGWLAGARSLGRKPLEVLRHE